MYNANRRLCEVQWTHATLINGWPTIEVEAKAWDWRTKIILYTSFGWH